MPKSIKTLITGVIVFNLIWWLFAVLFQNKALPNRHFQDAASDNNQHGDDGGNTIPFRDYCAT